jgi:aspartate ammonia-lyase
MPGKVNPVILESVINAGLKASANHGLVSATASMGTFQLVEFLPLCAFALLESIEILTAANRVFADHIEQIQANEQQCRDRTHANVSIITAFLPRIGYEQAQQLIREYEAGVHDRSFRDFLADRLGEEAVADAMRPENIMALGFRNRGN